LGSITWTPPFSVLRMYNKGGTVLELITVAQSTQLRPGRYRHQPRVWTGDQVVTPWQGTIRVEFS
jgi:hypothetical protein